MSSSDSPRVLTTSEFMNVFFPVGSAMFFSTLENMSNHLNKLKSAYSDFTFESGTTTDFIPNGGTRYYIKRTK